MTKSAEQHLFDFFSSRVSDFYPKSAGSFVCPLCLQTFETLANLNKAHLWPKALGGYIFTLACRKCNSAIGSHIEKHEAERVKRLQRKRVPFRQKIQGIEGDIGGFASVIDEDGEPTFVMDISERHSNPKTIQQQNAAFETGEILNRQVTLTINTGYSSQVAPLTYLHFAYMTLFHLADYSWISTAIADYIRQQLTNPKSATSPVYRIVFGAGEVEGLAEEAEPLLFEITTPQELRGYLIATPELKYANRQRTAVWVPRFFDPAKGVPRMESFQGTKFVPNFLTSAKRKPGHLSMQEQILDEVETKRSE